MSSDLDNDGTLEKLLKDYSPTEDDTKCGINSKFLQKFASKKTFVLMFSIIAAAYSGTYTYTMGTITTLEKRFKIPSKYSGMILVGHDISMMICSIGITYFAAKGHKPRWMALGVYLQVIYCFMMILPHMLYGAGDDAMSLTLDDKNLSFIHNSDMCEWNRTLNDCESNDIDNLSPLAIFFIGNLISGLGGPVIISLGTTYMDDNIKKSKVPFFLSLKGFLRMLGPTLGFSLSSLCLRYYIDPKVDPSINDTDPRWMGAYWIGWIVFMIYFIITAFLIGLFPKVLPRAAVRKRELIHKVASGKLSKSMIKIPEKASFKDIRETMARLFTNKVLIFNNLAAIFYIFGYLPYWTFQAKYIEIQYLLSPSTASLVTGTVSLVFSAIGILTSGLVISIYKPRARYLAAWNIITSIISIFGVMSYALNGCPANNNLQVMENSNLSLCNNDCNCDYIKYTPICGIDNKTYISPCHAGCKEINTLDNGMRVYTNCSCIDKIQASDDSFAYDAITGVCQVDCMPQFYMFLIIMCFNKFLGGTEGSSNFLIGIRCIEERDKTVSLALSMTIASLCSLIPSPIVFGSIIDSTCVLWGKTCSSTGNCWLYNAENLRYSMNFTAAGFVFIGTCFDVGTWYYAKDVKVFDEEEKNESSDEKRDQFIVL
uniref:Solute carrier organic anion transporter family member n=1 Tax=Culicoides sonorensis TaxID=179676 RepID=A0A336MET7_CULSO